MMNILLTLLIYLFVGFVVAERVRDKEQWESDKVEDIPIVLFVEAMVWPFVAVHMSAKFFYSVLKKGLSK